MSSRPGEASSSSTFAAREVASGEGNSTASIAFELSLVYRCKRQ